MRRRLPFFVWILPAIWAVASYAHSFHTGDEHAMYIISCIVGSWLPIVFRVGSNVHDPSVRILTSLTGAVLFAITGTIMDLIRSRPSRWAIVFMTAMLLIFASMLRSFPSLQRAIAKNGSLWTYILSATVLALYVSVILCIIGNGLTRLWKGVRGVADDVAECMPNQKERTTDDC